MSTKTERAIRSAWSELLYIADAYDWNAGPALRRAEADESKQARGAGVSYPKVEQLAGLCETALQPAEDVADLYGVRSGHVAVSIVVSRLRRRFPDEYDAWAEKHGDAVREFRRTTLAA